MPVVAADIKLDDSGYWNQIEGYIEKHSTAQLIHGMCQECIKETYGNEDWFDEDELDRHA